MRRVALMGASGFGREVMPLLRAQLNVEAIEQASLGAPYEMPHLCFVDDDPTADELNGQPVLTYADWVALPATSRQICIAIASSDIRAKLAARCFQDGVEFIEVRAQNVVEMDNVRIGAGAILSPFVTLTSNIRIGDHFHANIYSYVAHDCVIGDFVTFAPGVKCNGNVHVEDHAYIGTGAILKQGTPGQPLVIGRGAVVGMGAVVTKTVPPGVTVVGNPARPIEPK